MHYCAIGSQIVIILQIIVQMDEKDSHIIYINVLKIRVPICKFLTIFSDALNIEHPIARSIFIFFVELFWKYLTNLI